MVPFVKSRLQLRDGWFEAPSHGEEADAEEQDKKAPAEDTIIENEEEDTDVSEIIGGDIEDEGRLETGTVMIPEVARQSGSGSTTFE